MLAELFTCSNSIPRCSSIIHCCTVKPVWRLTLGTYLGCLHIQSHLIHWGNIPIWLTTLPSLLFFQRRCKLHRYVLGLQNYIKKYIECIVCLWYTVIWIISSGENVIAQEQCAELICCSRTWTLPHTPPFLREELLFNWTVELPLR